MADDSNNNVPTLFGGDPESEPPKNQKSQHLCEALAFLVRVGEGDRTLDNRNHNPGLYH